MSDYESAQKALEKIGVSLTNARPIPPHWETLDEEIIGPYQVTWAVAPEFYIGYEKGEGQQVVGGFGGAGINKFGIEIEVRTPENFGTDRVLEGAPFTRQEELWQEVLKTLERTAYPPQSYKLTGTTSVESPLNPEGRDWKAGDVVNVSRPTHDGGAFSLGIVTRIYPTTLEVTWPPDEMHPRAWTTLEEKNHMILVRNDPEWRDRVNGWYGRKEYAAEGKPPTWTELIKLEHDLLPRLSPLPYSKDTTHERKQQLKVIDVALEPYRIYGESDLDTWSAKDLGDSRAVEGYAPYGGLFPRSL